MEERNETQKWKEWKEGMEGIYSSGMEGQHGMEMKSQISKHLQIQLALCRQHLVWRKNQAVERFLLANSRKPGWQDTRQLPHWLLNSM